VSTYDEIAAQNRREAVLAMYAAMGCTPPASVTSPDVNVPSPVTSPVTSPKPVVTALATGVAARQARWRAVHPGEHRARHARYMRQLRARLASARNTPASASDATVPGTTADA